MEPATFGCIARCSNQLNQPARALQLLLSYPPSLTLLNSLPLYSPFLILKEKKRNSTHIFTTTGHAHWGQSAPGPTPFSLQGALKKEEF